jgi:AcrR family transcriptional regulator
VSSRVPAPDPQAAPGAGGTPRSVEVHGRSSSDITELQVGPDERVSVSRSQIAAGLAHIRELHEQERRADEGLRERKKRLTRQLISDTATWMFCERGFDNVRVAEIAAEVGVSEKTVFNYFPTKESLVFDREDDVVRGMREALTGRGPGETPTQAILAFIELECRHIATMGPEFRPMFLAFMRLVQETPALQISRQRMAANLVRAVREALAESVGVDPRDPEPAVAAHALVALWEVQLDSRQRHIRAGTPPAELSAAVLDDTRRAARLLDTGLWALHQVGRDDDAGPAAAPATTVPDAVRTQVFDALREARATWSGHRSAPADDRH